MEESDRRQALQEFLDATLSRGEVDAFLRRALDESYWRKLNPELSVGVNRPARALEATPLDQEHIDKHAERFRREGYFQTAPLVRSDVLSRMRAAIETLRAERWHPVFCFVYDEFWQIVRTPSILALATRILGKGFLQNSRVWAFYVAPARGARGWPPHTDAGGDPPRLTHWIPLTDATVANGCMYIIPADRLLSDVRRIYGELEGVTKPQLRNLLHSTRALPSPAGAYLGWDHELTHWGSVSDGDTEPRVALSLEFVGAGVKPQPDESPLLDPLQSAPAFDQRMRAIGKSLLGYQRFEPATRRYEELARRLSETTVA